MKKFTLIFIATILLCFSCEKLMAQAPYKASVGGMIQSFLASGISSKIFLTNNFSLQSDLLFKITLVPSFAKNVHGFDGIYFAVELNENLMYQKKLKDKKNSELFWLIGGGVSLGCEPMAVNGKFV